MQIDATYVIDSTNHLDNCVWDFSWWPLVTLNNRFQNILHNIAGCWM